MNMIGLEMHDAEHFFDIIADDCEEPNSTNYAFCLGNVGASGASPSHLFLYSKKHRSQNTNAFAAILALLVLQDFLG